MWVCDRRKASPILSDLASGLGPLLVLVPGTIPEEWPRQCRPRDVGEWTEVDRGVLRGTAIPATLGYDNKTIK